jgi:hypothetical protein
MWQSGRDENAQDIMILSHDLLMTGEESLVYSPIRNGAAV